VNRKKHLPCVNIAIVLEVLDDYNNVVQLKPNSITLASVELGPNMFGASSELVRSCFGAEIWTIILF